MNLLQRLKDVCTESLLPNSKPKEPPHKQKCIIELVSVQHSPHLRSLAESTRPELPNDWQIGRFYQLDHNARNKTGQSRCLSSPVQLPLLQSIPTTFYLQELDEYNMFPGRIEVPTLIHGLDLCHTPADSFKLKRVASSDTSSPATIADDPLASCSRDVTLSQPNSATGSLLGSECQVTSRQSSQSGTITRFCRSVEPPPQPLPSFFNFFQTICIILSNTSSIIQALYDGS